MARNLAEVLNPAATPLGLVNQVINACAEAKGKDIVVLDVTGIFDMAEYFVIVSGRSDRQVQGVTNRVLETLSALKVEPTSLEGMEQGHWVLADFGDVILHVFYEPVRSHYDLEGLWIKAKKLKIRDQTNSSAEMHLRAVK